MVPKTLTAEVIGIIDGDTVSILYDGNEYNVRILGINAIETDWHDPPYECKRQTDWGGAEGEQETWTPRTLADGEGVFNASMREIASLCYGTVTVLSDADYQFDFYGRLLAVILNDHSVNVGLGMLTAGYAAVGFYQENIRLTYWQQDYLDAENVAKNTNLGIWAFLAREVSFEIPDGSTISVDGNVYL